MAHISFEESQQILKENLPGNKDSEKVFLDTALNRVLAEDIVAKYNNPYMPTASMDGYAIKYEDMDKEIKIIGRNPAGSFEFNKINSGEAVKTFTGSFMPEGSDTLVPIENVEVRGDKLIVKEKVERGYSVRPVGEDFKEGEVLIKEGTLINAGEIGVLASLGKSCVYVTQKPIISVLATGEEIADINDEVKMGQIRSSNNYTLTALARSFGYDVKNLGIAGDKRDEIKNKILNALNSSDIVVTTGGVSVGDFDFVKEITGEFDVLFHGVNIKPGQWIMVAKAGGKYIVSLPGFPYSSFVTFLLYVVPIADAFENKQSIEFLTATLRDNFKKVFKKTQFVAVNLSFENGEYVVDTRGKKSGSSGILTNLINTKALMWLDEGLYELKAGSKVKIIKFF
ncbi:molybdopterin molybdotransferase [Lebetimonas natsushimae]|uniref:Molybdopterin molybdenumtransferase n=1 Tax=Lebetimonas natsushimae TaxID=1936991 RepID=A0A292YHH8_9BACT|nr:molybdopterin molybdotransferase MoeA [Lebetimonas natsushimae]GAX88351.1 molybdopterin molybdotransferase [Lebetimonas natsushimae]